MGSEFVQLISTVGFPIAACMALYYQSMKQDESMKNLTREVMDVVQKNTETITKFGAMMEEKMHERISDEG